MTSTKDTCWGIGRVVPPLIERASFHFIVNTKTHVREIKSTVELNLIEIFAYRLYTAEIILKRPSYFKSTSKHNLSEVQS